MDKIRVYELAKELNTTSKRLMEKLQEINIVVKNHMSLLEDHELEALYKHIGIIKHGDKRVVNDERKPSGVAPPPKMEHTRVVSTRVEPTRDDKKDKKGAPRIIRTTEIIIDSKNENKDTKFPDRMDKNRNDVRNGNNNNRDGNKNNQRQEIIRVADANTGLRPGFVRSNNRPDYKKEQSSQRDMGASKDARVSRESIIPPKSANSPLKEPLKEYVKPPAKEETKQEVKVEPKIEPKVEIKEEVKPVNKIEVDKRNMEEIKSIARVEEPMHKNDVSRNDAEKRAEMAKPDVPKIPEPAKVYEVAKMPESVGAPAAGEKGNPQHVEKAQNVEPNKSGRDEHRHNEKPQGGGYKGQNDRPQGGHNRPQGDRPQGDRPQGGYNRPQGDRPYGDRPQGGHNRPQGDRPQGGYNRPQGDRPQGDRPQGGYNRPQGDRPQGDRPQGGYNRPQGDRPQGDRPQGGYNRPQGDRPQGDRPQGGYNRPQGDRPQGDRPQGGYNRPQGDRPQGDRPQGGYNRPYGDRPQGGGRGPNDRPQGGGFRGPNDRPQGGGFNRQGSRPGEDRPRGGFRQGSKSLEIPKVELSASQKDEMTAQRNSEVRREFQNKDVDKDVKREQKRDVPKGQATVSKSKPSKPQPQKVVLGEKKGVSEILSEDYILDVFYDDDSKKNKKVNKPRKLAKEEVWEPKHIPPKAVLTLIKIPEALTVKELAEALKKTSTEVIKKLMGLGIMATLNHEIDFDTATIVAEEFGVKTEKEVVVNEEDILFDDSEEEDETNLVPRPPVVVVMGHVDHGKTSLLDAIRETNVIDSEAGGITQHIGAYMVKINNKNITFLDTPGHEAFTAMRARGAQVTDIAILVVAADDGVMPQTVEAINHAKAANVSIIVAVNKIDKPGANPERVKQELTEHGLVVEEWGGDVICVPVSAKKRMNIDHLLEMVLLAADMLELKANPEKQAKGTIIEAKLDKGRGPVATMLVQRGTLNVGDSIVTGTTVGRIRAMLDDKGHKLKKAGPSTPVEIIGMPEVPEAGEIFYAITDERVAKQLAEKRKFKQREQQLKSSARISLDDLFTQIKEGKVKDLNIIVKADVQGSVEAVKQSLEKLSNDEVRVNIVHGGVGAITESDITLATVSNAIIIGFNVRPNANVIEAAKNASVDMRLYRVIYNAIEDIQAAMKGMLDPTFKEVVQGHAEIRQIFKVSGIGTIGGAYVTDGKVTRNSEIRVVRNGIVIHEGKLASLKRFKDDAKEVLQGYECGLSVDRFNDIKESDVIEAYIMEEVAR